MADAQTGDFLGITILGVGAKPRTAEMARLNAVSAWSQIPQDYDVVNTYRAPVRQGLGTAEACTMMQYAQFLKNNKHVELEAVVATSRIDNPGSWKSNAKAGMEVIGVDSNPNYGPELRYQLRKNMS